MTNKFGHLSFMSYHWGNMTQFPKPHFFSSCIIHLLLINVKYWSNEKMCFILITNIDMA